MKGYQLDVEAIFNNSIDLLCLAGLDGYFKRVNPAFMKTLGYTEEELLSKPFVEFVHPQDRKATLAEVEKLASGQDSIHFQNRYRCQDGTYKWLSWMCPAPKPGDEFLFAIARDLTELKETEEALHRSETELRDKNAALQEILGRIEVEKQQIKEAVMSNIEELILPVLAKLKRKGGKTAQPYLEVMEKNLQEMSSSFGHKISSKKWHLTPREIEICNMIKNGLSSKDIAATLNTSLRTVENHRNHIRAKLGLAGRKTNLVTYLQAI